MFLNDQQMTVTVERTARALMPFFDRLNNYERYTVTNEIAAAALPIILKLPEGAVASDMENFSELVREHALVLIVQKIRSNGGLEDATDENILEHVDPEVITMFAHAVHQMVAVALDSIPPVDNHELEELAANIEDVDWDSELEKLMEDDE